MIRQVRSPIVANRTARWDGLLAFTVMAVIVVLPSKVRANSDDALERARAASTSIYWQQMPLDRGLKSLSDSHDFVILLDRRIDPDRRCSCDVSDIPFDDALRQITGSMQLGVGTIGPIYIVGQPRTAVVLATAAELANDRHREFAEPLRGKLVGPKPWSWKRLSTPAQLIAELAEEAGLTITNPNVIPHDLWDARSLPPLSWAERMMVVLAGFDMYFEVDPQRQAITLTPLPDQLSLRRVYRVRGNANDTAKKLSEQFPRAFLQVDGDTIAVRSLVEDHWKIARLLAGPVVLPGSNQSAGNQDQSRRRYTLTVQDEPLGPLLRVLARRTELTLVIDESARTAMSERVSFSVEEVPVEVLFQQAVAPKNLTAILRDGEVTIRGAAGR